VFTTQLLDNIKTLLTNPGDDRSKAIWKLRVSLVILFSEIFSIST